MKISDVSDPGKTLSISFRVKDWDSNMIEYVNRNIGNSLLIISSRRYRLEGIWKMTQDYRNKQTELLTEEEKKDFDDLKKQFKQHKEDLTELLTDVIGKNVKDRLNELLNNFENSKLNSEEMSKIMNGIISEEIFSASQFPLGHYEV